MDYNLDDPNFRKIIDPGNLTGINDPSVTPTPIPYQAENQATSQAYLARLGGYGNQFNAAQEHENALGRYFQRVMAGQGPSVVQQQLQAGQDQLARQQQAQAAGTSGINAAMARRQAMQNTAQGQAQVNQTQALARTQEQADAAKLSAQLRANQATQAQGMFGINTVGASNFANTAAGGASKSADIAQQELDAQRTAQGNRSNAIGGLFAKAASDERAKTNIDKVTDPAMEQFLKHLSGFTFNYKDPNTDGQGQRVGVMAQDVKKGGPIGEDVVIDGKKLMLDGPNGLGAALGAIGYLAKRVKELEGRRA